MSARPARADVDGADFQALQKSQALSPALLPPRLPEMQDHGRASRGEPGAHDATRRGPDTPSLLAQKLAAKHFDTLFICAEVSNVPFLVNKIEVQVLPCVVGFVSGISKIKCTSSPAS